MPSGYPWGDRKAETSNPDIDTFSTGVTRYYNFTVARGILSPDGYGKSLLPFVILPFMLLISVETNGIFVNGQFPAPPIEANWGDTVQVVINNRITGPEEGTSMHWHGIRQKGTQWFDGVPSVTQCPIAPGSSITYRFKADTYGTSWYHSHFSAQYIAGVWGPMTIYGPKNAPYDIDSGPLMLGDHYHKDYVDVVAAAAGNSSDFNVYVPTSDNSLINGKNNYNCSLAIGNTTCNSNAGLSKFMFVSGKTHRLRLINGGAAALVKFSIDGHALQVIANDFTPIQPYNTDVVILGVGQRTDVLVKAIGKPEDAYWMRSTISLNCSVTTTTKGLGVVLYERAGDSKLPASTMSAAVVTADLKTTLCRNVSSISSKVMGDYTADRANHGFSKAFKKIDGRRMS